MQQLNDLRVKNQNYEKLMHDLDQKIRIQQVGHEQTALSIEMVSRRNMSWVNSVGGQAPLNPESESKPKKKGKKDVAEDPMKSVPISVNSVAFNQNEQRENQFITVDDSAQMRLWDAKRGVMIAEEPRFSNGLLATCAIEPSEGRIVACGGIDGKVHLFQVNKETRKNDHTIKMIQKQAEFNGHQSQITCSGFLSNNYLITGSDDSDLMLWDFEKAGRYLVKYSDHTLEVQSLDVFNRDGNIIASGANDAAVRIWDIRMKQPCLRVFDKNQCGISAVRFMPDNVNTLAIGKDDSSINLIDLRTLGRLGKYKEKNIIVGISSLQFSKSGRLLFSCSSASNRIVIWDILAQDKAGEMGPELFQDGVKSISLSRDGTTLVSGGKGGTVALWT